jgi:hypothetical protein
MNEKLKNLSEIVAKANDLFYSKFDKIDTIMGIMDKKLRQQGMKADAITIDCIAKDKKIVLLIHDSEPNIVGVALGNRVGDIYSSSEVELSTITVAAMVEIMTANFTP